MNSETRTCQNCRTKFTIEPDDFSFYEKLKVPPPTWCPECRLVRRLAWCNERSLFKKKDTRSGKEIFSQFSPHADIKIYDRDYWWSDAWDPLSYGKDIDWSRPFLAQLRELMYTVPWPSKAAYDLVRSDYCQNVAELKDCYLFFGGSRSENVYYSVGSSTCRECADILNVRDSELCYECFDVRKSYRAFYSSHLDACHDVWFSENLSGCSDCFGCFNLRNKSHYVFNELYSAEKYAAWMREWHSGSAAATITMKDRIAHERLRFPVKYYQGKNNANVSGDYINNSRNVHNSFLISDSENLRYAAYLLSGARECMDFTRFSRGSELIYECVMCGRQCAKLKFCFDCQANCHDLDYCIVMHDSSDLFGCVGLIHRKHCILNKQYTEAEYRALVPKIIAHMNAMPYQDAKGRIYPYGEFLPPEFSPLAYPETLAQEFFPLTKTDADKKGFPWRELEQTPHEGSIAADTLPDAIADAPDSLADEAIRCAHAGTCDDPCTEAFKIIPQELRLYHKLNLPLPRLCSNCRYWQRIRQRNPFRLWNRTCACAGLTSKDRLYRNAASHRHGSSPCEMGFETSYSPDRPEIVYCEQCYQTEVA